MRSAILTASALAAFLVFLLASYWTDSLAQTPPGIQISPDSEWIALSDRAALVISDFSVHDGSVRGRLMVELDGQWAPVRFNDHQMLPLQ
jgi:hypothetical protein